jgi:ribosomal protein S27E
MEQEERDHRRGSEPALEGRGKKEGEERRFFMKNEYSKEVNMVCPNCGGKTFEFDPAVADDPVRCVSCNRTYSREALIKSNQKSVAAGVEDMKKEVMKDATNDFKKMLKKTWGKKNFKIK